MSLSEVPLAPTSMVVNTPPAVEKAVALVRSVKVLPDDLARVVDARRDGAVGAQRIGDAAVSAVAVEEAVLVEAGVDVKPDDLTESVDANRLRVTADAGIGARGVGVSHGGEPSGAAAVVG